MSEALNPTYAGGHACKPTALAGYSPHSADLGSRFVCKCGAIWRATRFDPFVNGRQVCGCGWERVEA